jgi:hypothetical protein
MTLQPSSAAACRLLGSIALAALTLAATAGCSPKKQKGVLSGKVTYKGQSLQGGILILHPTGEGGSPYQIPLKGDGTFTVSDVPPGQYKVTVQVARRSNPVGSFNMGKVPAGSTLPPDMEEKMKKQLPAEASGGAAGPTDLPAKYTDPNQTPLTMKVEVGDQAPQNFDLTD